jgi:cobaltochelatase CobN
LHNHLHELAETAQPLGLHTLGRAPEEQHRLATVLLMLGRPFWEAAALHAAFPPPTWMKRCCRLRQAAGTAPYQLLQRHVVQGEHSRHCPRRCANSSTRPAPGMPPSAPTTSCLRLLHVLVGRHLPTSYGGDPIKNPDAYPTGRNLYGFDPRACPQQAWAAGKEAAEQLIAEHRRLTGKQPKKLAVSLWSVETMRHQGLLEAQALWLLGTEPVWDEGAASPA